jgi:hypothetical protein
VLLHDDVRTCLVEGASISLTRPSLNSRKTVRAAMSAQNRASSDLGPGSAIPLGSLRGSGGAGAVSRIRFRVDAETVVSDDTAVSDSSRSKDRKA